MESVGTGKLSDYLVGRNKLAQLRAAPDFCRSFVKWCKTKDVDVSTEQTFNAEFKSCLVSKYLRSLKKHRFQYTLDLRFSKTHDVVCGSECQKVHDFIKYNGQPQQEKRCVVATEQRWHYYKRDGVVDGRKLTFDDLAQGRTVCERTEPNRPAKFGIDADASWHNMESSCMGKRVPKNGFEFANYILEVFQNVVSTKLGIDQAFKAVVSHKSDYHPSMEFGENMKAKCSYHIVMDEFWMPDWRTYGSMIAQLMLDVDHERNSWLQDGVLDTSVYGNYKLFGCVLSGKFTDYEKQGDDFRRMVLDPNFPDVSSYLLHCYDDDQPKCLDIPLLKAEKVVPTREGSCPEIASKKVSKRTAQVYAEYQASGVQKDELDSTTSAGYIQVVNLLNAHYITDVTITRLYVIMAKFEGVAETVAWERLYNAAARINPSNGDEQRRIKRVLSGRHFRIWWKKVKDPLPTDYIQAATKLQQFCNYELKKGVLLKCMLKEALGISSRWDANTVEYRARYASDCISADALKTKVHCLQFRMGQGKSSLMLQWIKQLYASKQRILILSTSLNLCNKWKHELIAEGCYEANTHQDFTEHYQQPGLCPLYVSTFQSLRKLQGAIFDYVFIDEIVLVKEDATCSETNPDINANFEQFELVVQEATNVIAADALLSSIELEWLEDFVPKKEITIHKNTAQWGEFGTRTKQAIIYPKHNITIKRQQTAKSSLWFLSLKKHLRVNKDKLTHVHITPTRDMNKVMSTCCSHAAVDFMRAHLTHVPQIDDIILQLAGLIHDKPARRSLYSMDGYKQPASEIGECLQSDAERLKHSTKVWYTSLWTNSSVTAGVSWDMKSAYTSTWLCASTYIHGAQRMLQSVNRIRQTKNNCEQTLHLTVKASGNRKPELAHMTLGKFATFASAMSQSTAVIKQHCEKTNAKLKRCWATHLYKKALWQQFPQSCLTFLLRANGWKVRYNNGDFAKQVAKPNDKFRRPKRKISTIADVGTDWMKEFGQLSFNKRQRYCYDQTARTTKYLVNKSAAAPKVTTIHYALKQMKCCSADDLAAIKNSSLEEIINSWTPTDECLHILEREHEIVLRLKGDFTTPPSWKVGIKLLHDEINENDRTNTYHLWCKRRTAVQAVRWMRSGKTIDEAEEQLLERFGIYGQWDDKFIPKFRLVAELEQHVLGKKSFCERLMLTPEEYKAALRYLEENEEKYARYYSFKTPIQLFRLVLDFYALKVTKHMNARKNTRPIDLGKLPTLRQKNEQKEFFAKLKTQYPALHQKIARVCLQSTPLMMKWWKKNAANNSNYSLVSKLSNTPNTRLFWRLNDEGM